MLEVTRKGGSFAVRELWKTEEVGGKMHPALLYDGHLYLDNCGKAKGMMFFSLDGKLVWEKRSAPSFHLGAMALADGLILNRNGKNGDLHPIEPSPKG